MSEGSAGFSSGLIIALILSILIVLNMDRSIRVEVFNNASSYCKANNGMDVLLFDVGDFEIRCKDGAIFYKDYKELRGDK